METYIPLTIADAHNFSAVIVQSKTLILTAEFTLVSAYLAGMYFFISKTRMPLRVFAHGFAIFMVIYFWVLLTIEFAVIESYLEHRDIALEAGTITRDTESSLVRQTARGTGVAVLEWGAHIAHLVTIGALSYLAFFFDWSKPVDA